MKQPKWVLIVRTISNEYIKTETYQTKKDALTALNQYTSLAYIITMLSYSVYYMSGCRLEGET